MQEPLFHSAIQFTYYTNRDCNDFFAVYVSEMILVPSKAKQAMHLHKEIVPRNECLFVLNTANRCTRLHRW